jgi:hypothetical protein
MTPDERKHSLAGIVPSALPAFSELLEQAESWGFEPRIVEALRTCDEQRWSKNSKVYERSWHVLGRAVDLELQGVDAYRRLGEYWEEMGGTWGGRWTTLYPPRGDFQHFQWSGGRDGIPETIWRSGERCEDARERYLTAEAQAGLPMAIVGPRRGLGAALARSSFVPGALTIGGLVALQRAEGGTLPRGVLVAGVVAGGLASLLWPIVFGGKA